MQNLRNVYSNVNCHLQIRKPDWSNENRKVAVIQFRLRKKRGQCKGHSKAEKVKIL